MPRQCPAQPNITWQPPSLHGALSLKDFWTECNPSHSQTAQGLHTAQGAEEKTSNIRGIQSTLFLPKTWKGKKKKTTTCMQLNILKILFHCYLYLPILITDKKSSQNMDKGKQETISNVLFSKSHRTLFIPKVHPTCPLIHLNLHHC